MELAAAVVTEHKLELVCADEAAEALIDVISQAAHTGQPEAGWVFVSDVQHAVEIR
jgi:nitrogen regulatory protein P-II 1